MHKKEHSQDVTCNQFSGFRTDKFGFPFCKLMGKVCDMPEVNNNTNKTYCEFIQCQQYEKFQNFR